MAEHRLLLRYAYVADIAERRGEHRAAHLAYLGALHEAGTVLTAGATGDPVSGALIVCSGSLEEVEAVAAGDPYMRAGLITGHSIEPWTVVLG